MRNGFVSNLQIFVAGALVGSAVAIMTTPYTGSRMRRLVRHKIEDGTDQLTEAMTGLRDTCEELYTLVRSSCTRPARKPPAPPPVVRIPNGAVIVIFPEACSTGDNTLAALNGSF